MQEGFLLRVQDALLFFRYCRMYKIDGRKERIEVARRLVARDKARYIRDADAFGKGKSMLRIHQNFEGDAGRGE